MSPLETRALDSTSVGSAAVLSPAASPSSAWLSAPSTRIQALPVWRTCVYRDYTSFPSGEDRQSVQFQPWASLQGAGYPGRTELVGSSFTPRVSASLVTRVFPDGSASYYWVRRDMEITEYQYWNGRAWASTLPAPPTLPAGAVWENTPAGQAPQPIFDDVYYAAEQGTALYGTYAVTGRDEAVDMDYGRQPERFDPTFSSGLAVRSTVPAVASRRDTRSDLHPEVARSGRYSYTGTAHPNGGVDFFTSQLMTGEFNTPAMGLPRYVMAALDAVEDDSPPPRPGSVAGPWNRVVTTDVIFFMSLNARLSWPRYRIGVPEAAGRLEAAPGSGQARFTPAR